MSEKQETSSQSPTPSPGIPVTTPDSTAAERIVPPPTDRFTPTQTFKVVQSTGHLVKKDEFEDKLVQSLLTLRSPLKRGMEEGKFTMAIQLLVDGRGNAACTVSVPGVDSAAAPSMHSAAHGAAVVLSLVMQKLLQTQRVRDFNPDDLVDDNFVKIST